MDAPAPLQVHLLGRFRVALHGRVIPDDAWRQRRAAAVVKFLALTPTHRRHREQLIEHLWPELGGDAAANNLRVALTRARRVLEAHGADPGRFLKRDGQTYALAMPGDVWIDVDAFESSVGHAWATGQPADAQAALDVYAGDLLPDDPYDDWAADRRLALRTSYLALLAHLAAQHEERHELGQAIAIWQRFVLAEPLDETAHTALMALFARIGEPRQAALQYERLTTLLDDELGAEPDAATRNLMTAIQEGRFPPTFEPRARASGVDRPPRDEQRGVHDDRAPGLPAPLDDLVGRDRELSELQRVLAVRRLVTLTGPAGVGKTRLALAAAMLAAAATPVPTALADLTALRDPELVLPTISSALGLVESGDHPLLTTTVAHLGEAPFLLVVDNFEQVMLAARTVSDLLAACPGLRMIVTSRGPLRLRGEQEYPVSPLAIPASTEPATATNAHADLRRFSAIELFLQRAGEARPDLSPTDADIEAIAEICRRLDGLPLAIELAAARVRIVSPGSLLTLLEQPLAILTGGPRDAPDRQRTLRAAIAWSYDLLDPAAQALFMRLAVFSGSFGLGSTAAIASDGDADVDDAAKDATSDLLDLVTALINQSLLRRGPETGGEPRFSLLVTIRDFAAERLAESGLLDTIRNRHADWFLSLAEHAEPKLVGADAATWLDRLEQDHDNLRAALTTFAEVGAPDNLPRLAAALWRFWWLRGHLTEGRAHLERALAQGALASPAVRAKAHDGAGALAAAQGDLESAITRHAAALDLWRSIGDRDGTVNALTNLGLVADEQGDPKRAAAYLREALPLARAAGNRRGVAVILANLGQVAMTRQEHESAAAFLSESATLIADLGDRQSQAAILANLGILAFLVGDYPRAETCHETALTLFRELADLQSEAEELLNLGHTVQQRDDVDHAAVLFGEALDRFTNLGDRSGQAFALIHLGRLAYARSNHDQAEDYLQDGFALGQQYGDQVAAVEAIEGLAMLARVRGDFSLCARLSGASATTRARIGVPLPPVHLPEVDRCLTDARQALGPDAFALAMAEGQAFAVQHLDVVPSNGLTALPD